MAEINLSLNELNCLASALQRMDCVTFGEVKVSDLLHRLAQEAEGYKWTLTEIRRMSESTRSDILIETIDTKGDWYLDRLDTGQYLISFAESPKAIFASLLAAKEVFRVCGR